jgi:hypothetical protein
MLLGLPVTVQNRKLRLFALACCHRIEARLTHHHGRQALIRQALILAEKYTEGLAADEEMKDLSHRFQDEYNARFAASGEGWDATNTTDLDAAYHMIIKVFPANTALSVMGAAQDPAEERSIQCLLLRCIFGNPFHPYTLDPCWLNPTVKDLAHSLYSDRRFEDLPILADALEEAGCQEQSVLEHLRSPGPHVRGCWPLDLILGRA